MLNNVQKNKLINLLLIVIGFVFMFEVLFYHSIVINSITSFVESSGVLAWLLIGIVQFLQVVLIPIPAYFITLTSMKMFPDNLPMLFIVTLIIVTLGCLTAYLIGRKWGKKAVIWVAGNEEEYNKWLNIMQSKKTNLFYLITIIFPIFPDDILCILAGSMKMNLGWFIMCNIIGRAIGLFVFMFVFTTIQSGLTSIIIFGVILLLLTIYKIVIKRRLKNEFTNNR